MTNKRPLIVMALREEGQGMPEALGFEVLYTGVGKVNAAYALTRRLRQDDVSAIINLGSAGSHVHPRGSLLAADRFVQHDMDVTGLGFALGQTPFDAGEAMLQVSPRYGHLLHGICASGDRFVQDRLAMACDMVDMEAYALAKIALAENLPFSSVKYITDGADGTAAGDWQSNLVRAAEAFHQLLVAHEL
jgi:adenosylhomocysteine nucleosidase